MFAVGEVFECGGYLVELLHTGAERATAVDDHDVTGFYLVVLVAGLDCRNSVAFGCEDAGFARVAVYAVVINNCWVDGGGLDDGALWREVAARECDGAGEAF